MVISLISLAHVEEEPTPERPVACFGDLQPFDFERLPPFADHVLSSRGSESYAHQLCQLVGREAVHAHDVFGAASRAATGEQRKRAALMGLWGARWSRARHRVIESDLLILTQRLRLGKIPRNRASSLRARRGEAGALTRHLWNFELLRIILQPRHGPQWFDEGAETADLRRAFSGERATLNPTILQLTETDCVAGVRGLELGNPRMSHVFETL